MKLQIHVINVMIHATVVQDPLNIIVLLAGKVDISFKINVS